MPRKMKNHAGMTLVEVLIALALLAIITAPVLGMFVSGTRLSTASYKLTSATVTAQMRMEELVGLNTAELMGEVGDIRLYNGFSVGAVITADGVGGFENLKEVTVTVFDIGGAPLYSLTNIINTAHGGIPEETP